MSRFKPTIRRSTREGYVRGIKARAYPRRRYTPVRQYVPRTMGPFSASESKYFDTEENIAVANFATTWAGTEIDNTTLSCLFAPSEGSDIDNRIGRKVQVYKLALRGQYNSTPSTNQADSLAPNFCRIIIYMDTQTNGTQSQGEDLMAGSASNAITSFQNLANLGRFRVLRDFNVKLREVNTMTDGTNTSSQAIGTSPWKATIKFKKPVIVKFNATNGGTIGDIVDNSFHIIAMEQGGYTGNIQYNCRTYYKDH